MVLKRHEAAQWPFRGLVGLQFGCFEVEESFDIFEHHLLQAVTRKLIITLQIPDAHIHILIIALHHLQLGHQQHQALLLIPPHFEHTRPFDLPSHRQVLCRVVLVLGSCLDQPEPFFGEFHGFFEHDVVAGERYQALFFVFLVDEVRVDVGFRR